MINNCANMLAGPFARSAIGVVRAISTIKPTWRRTSATPAYSGEIGNSTVNRRGHVGPAEEKYV